MSSLSCIDDKTWSCEDIGKVKNKDGGGRKQLWKVRTRSCQYLAKLKSNDCGQRKKLWKVGVLKPKEVISTHTPLQSPVVENITQYPTYWVRGEGRVEFLTFTMLPNGDAVNWHTTLLDIDALWDTSTSY